MVIYQNYTEIHGQQNIKDYVKLCILVHDSLHTTASLSETERKPLTFGSVIQSWYLKRKALNRRCTTVISLLRLVTPCRGRSNLPPGVSDTGSAPQSNPTIKTLPMQGHYELQYFPSSIRRNQRTRKHPRASAGYPVVDNQLSPNPLGMLLSRNSYLNTRMSFLPFLAL